MIGEIDGVKIIATPKQYKKCKKSLEEQLEEKGKEIERLNKKIEQYENPEDMTLMFMYCDEKAKDEIKRLNNIIKKLEEFIEREIELYTIELTEENKNKLSIVVPIRGVYKEIYNVLQELKGSDK